MGMGQEIVIKVLSNRFEVASKKVLKHPKFDEVTRKTTENQLAAFMIILDQSLEASGGELTLAHHEIINPIVGFLDLIDEFCDTDYLSNSAQLLA